MHGNPNPTMYYVKLRTMRSVQENLSRYDASYTNFRYTQSDYQDFLEKFMLRIKSYHNITRLSSWIFIFVFELFLTPPLVLLAGFNILNRWIIISVILNTFLMLILILIIVILDIKAIGKLRDLIREENTYKLHGKGIHFQFATKSQTLVMILNYTPDMDDLDTLIAINIFTVDDFVPKIPKEDQYNYFLPIDLYELSKHTNWLERIFIKISMWVTGRRILKEDLGACPELLEKISQEEIKRIVTEIKSHVSPMIIQSSRYAPMYPFILIMMPIIAMIVLVAIGERYVGSILLIASFEFMLPVAYLMYWKHTNVKAQALFAARAALKEINVELWRQKQIYLSITHNFRYLHIYTGVQNVEQPRLQSELNSMVELMKPETHSRTASRHPSRSNYVELA